MQIYKKGRSLVSVIMPVYNGEIFVREAIQSIIDQTYKNWELIIVDDCSVDNTVSVVKEFRDKRIKLIKLDKRVNVPKVRNIALNNVSGKYVMLLDADDVSLPDRMLTQLNFLERNEDYTLVGSWCYYIDESSVKMGESKNVISNGLIKATLYFGNCITNSSVMIRTKELLIVRYDEKIDFAEDYNIFAKLASTGKYFNIPECLVCYRIHTSNTTNSYDLSHKNNCVLASLIEYYQIAGVILNLSRKKILENYVINKDKSGIDREINLFKMLFIFAGRIGNFFYILLVVSRLFVELFYLEKKLVAKIFLLFNPIIFLYPIYKLINFISLRRYFSYKNEY